MADDKKTLKLPNPEEIASAKPLLDLVAKRQEALAKAKGAATKGDEFNKYDSKYRTALKNMKRAQRKLHKELIRVAASNQPPKEAESK